ncbi:hypothetical protein BVwin_13520 [Bartonella vinsonii subsp. berkhoffii str. Winnie]|nr:hypothetical protein BVwin_13520 [Bartonella vinsonii subsp. berkhoffii str. Winnie]
MLATGVEMQTQDLYNDMFIGKKIRFRQKMLKMFQKELGRHLGVSSQQIQKYETGLNRVSTKHLKEISERFDTPLSFFTRISSQNKNLHTIMMKSSRANKNICF